ncbi:MAG: 4'-phosphopantetheinyl transferase family protein [Janthinobacterium lividum]
MPLHRLLRLSPTAVLGLWHRAETAAALGALLPAGAPYAALLPPTAGPERQGQWLAGRVLAHAVAAALWPGAPALWVRNDAATGRPCLGGPGAPAGAVVSLSHSGAWAAALLATSGRVGVDVEWVRDKARRIAPKFLSATELAAAQAVATDAHFTLLWSAKETLYKLAERRGLIFKEQLLLDPFAPAPAGEIPAALRLADGQSRHRICYFQPAAGYVLTHCWEPGAPTATRY